jgi:hypothetical protein
MGSVPNGTFSKVATWQVTYVYYVMESERLEDKKTMQLGPLEDPQESIDAWSFMKKRLIRSRLIALGITFVCLDSTILYLAHYSLHSYRYILGTKLPVLYRYSVLSYPN